MSYDTYANTPQDWMSAALRHCLMSKAFPYKKEQMSEIYIAFECACAALITNYGETVQLDFDGSLGDFRNLFESANNLSNGLLEPMRDNLRFIESWKFASKDNYIEQGNAIYNEQVMAECSMFIEELYNNYFN